MVVMSIRRTFALSVYLSALARRDLRLALAGATTAKQAKNTWWLAHTLAAIPAIEELYSTTEDESGSSPLSDQLEGALTDSWSPILESAAFGKVVYSFLADPYQSDHKVESAPS